MTLAAELLENEPSDSPARKLLLQNAKQLQACESAGIRKGDALKRGYISESDEQALSAPEGAENVSDKKSALTSSRNLTGFTGLRIMDGRIADNIKYSPVYFSKAFQPDDEVISIDSVSLHGLANDVVRSLVKGTPGTMALPFIQDLKRLRRD